ncbi:sensor histidine kinase [Anaerophilus nitritogenes]|uniref:sensor histidine kinase n=1 Tax=Anaerophilus nitritogenes TaxID=2498136 RepID=UPI00101B731F|nr:GHKL domain-containing protein [Anaerophilus nitritogenes]
MNHTWERKYKRIIVYLIIQTLLLSILVNNDFMKRLNYFQSKHMAVIELLLGIVILIMHILIIFIIKDLYKTWKEEGEYNTNKVKYNFIQEENRRYIKHKHDIKNHILVMRKLLEDQEHDKLNNYICHYSREIDNILITVDVGCTELDILIYSKIKEARKLDIGVEFKNKTYIHCNKNKIIPLVSILSNLLDNTIDACKEIPKEGRKIFITIESNPLDYIFIIKNRYDNKNINMDEIYKEGFSTKENRGRGYGISIIKERVQKLEGDLDIFLDNDYFVVKISIPKFIME